MTTRLASITLAPLALLAAPGWAADPSDAECSVDAARKYRIKPALARGLPVTVKCDGPATFFVAMRFTGHGEKHISRQAHPGHEGFSATVDSPTPAREPSGSSIPKPAAQPYAKIVR